MSSNRTPASALGRRHWCRIDLLFFYRRMRCIVAIDLKLDKLTHADAKVEWGSGRTKRKNVQPVVSLSRYRRPDGRATLAAACVSEWNNSGLLA